MRRHALTAVLAPLALAACGDGGGEVDPGADDNAAAPAATDTADAGPPPGPDGDDGELGSDAVMQGEWFANEVAGNPAAMYGPPQSEAAFSVRCEGSTLVFGRSEEVEGGGPVEMTLMAGGRSRTISASAQTDPMPQVSARLPASDSFAAVLADATQPIAVRVGDGSSFRMPAHAHLREVVANCRG